MQKIVSTILVSFILTQTVAQQQKKLSMYLFTQYNKTIYDRTSDNNPWGFGLGFQAFLNNKSKFKPTLEITGDAYMEDGKTLRLNDDGSIPVPYNDVRGMVNVFVGASFHPTEFSYVSVLVGPSLIRGAYLGMKSSFGIYFSETQKWTVKISYINIFNRDKLSREDFGTISLAVGFKLF